NLGAIARSTGRSLEECAYDALMASDGRAQLVMHSVNYARGSYDEVGEMMVHPHALVGLSDGGAHVRMICDAANPTFTLIFWGRERTRGPRLPLQDLVRMHSGALAEAYGFSDRGTLSVGKRADINVIDFAGLQLGLPYMTFDLPTGGKRLLQGARGYVATLVKGEVTRRNDVDTGARPGRLVRDEGWHPQPLSLAS
ncbi:MAG: amidohydrolase, partial [Caulobacteraceae bacterium]|nr:amidohydrolase [Caulobacteraceae bacterium]